MSNPVVRFRVDFGARRAVGPGKIALLEHIVRQGSLSQAARELGMSYRRAWQLLESLNGCFSERLVLTSRGGRGGGGAQLTPLGRQLIRTYRAFDAQLQSHAARTFRALARAAGRRTARTRAAAIKRLTDR